MKRANTQENLAQEGISLQNENNRQIKEKVIRKPKDKNDGLQVPTRYEKYCLAKGHLRGQSRPEVFSFKRSNRETFETSEEINQLTNPPHSGQRVYGTDGIAPTVTTGKKVWIPTIHNLQQRSPNRPSLTRLCDCNSGKLYQKCCGVPGGSGHLSKKDGSTYCLDTTGNQGVEIDGKLRKLTEIECERLQGFEDNWTEGISSTQRYKCLGNAVTVNVVYEVAKNL